MEHRPTFAFSNLKDKLKTNIKYCERPAARARRLHRLAAASVGARQPAGSGWEFSGLVSRLRLVEQSGRCIWGLSLQRMLRYLSRSFQGKTKGRRCLMEITDLLDEEVEVELRNWITSFAKLSDLYAGLPLLFSKLTAQRIEGTVEDSVSVEGPIHMGSRSFIRASSVIIGPAIIAEDVMIASSVEISERTYIGRCCSISHCATIRNSLILNRTTVGAGAYISDSLVGPSCTIGPGALIGIEPVDVHQTKSAGARFVAVGSRSRVEAGAILKCGAELV
jgi:carbonic anhydrase/acetyltransferase-like protein (isoleucine patch superfamily)